ncbi:MAG: FAD-dependent oxidoreductase [Vicinamibacteria bacterium]|jgi:glycerol-3-phosphate dehydrogenase|nr:FAD-dependent oxidoreductase [Vicinamibacteria bacterium]
MTRDIEALRSSNFDLLVVGGGIHGAAAAWDAAERGLKVALVEARDFASGTSANSLKTIHGGLRYLQKLDLKRMRESIADRRAFLRIAPSLVRPLAFLAPTIGHGRNGRAAFALGMCLNDLIAYDRNRGLPSADRIPATRLLSADETASRFPGVPREGLTGGAEWWDAQAQSSERLVLALLHAAAGREAQLANYIVVTGFLRQHGRVAGVTARDERTGREITLSARLTLLSVGPWLGELWAQAGLARSAPQLLDAINVVFSRPSIGAVALGSRLAGRYLFLVPWRGYTMLGTDYVPAEQASPLGARVRAFVQDAQRAFPGVPLTTDDISFIHQGRVPGTGDAAGLATRDSIIDHEREDSLPGLISQLPVKFTTARAVAERTIDLVFARLGRERPACRTSDTPLVHAQPMTRSLEDNVQAALRDEMAWHLTDVVLRRTDLGTAAPPDADTLNRVIATMRTALGWTAAQEARERAALATAYAWDLDEPRRAEPSAHPW